MQQIEFNVFYIIGSVKKHAILFLTLNILVVVIATIISMILPIKYDSTAVFYPYSPEALDPRMALFNETHFNVFGYNDQVERYTKIGKSNAIKLFLGKKYNLFSRYKIDTTDAKFTNFKLIETLKGEIKFAKGESGSVIVTVTHFDRDTAAMMCNDIVAKIDSTNSALFLQKNAKIFDLYKAPLVHLELRITQLKDSINAISASKNDKSNKNIDLLNTQLNFASEEYSKASSKYELLKSFTNTPLKTLYLVEAAEPSYSKSQPNRKLLIGGAVAVSLIITSLLFTVFEFFKDNKKNMKW